MKTFKNIQAKAQKKAKKEAQTILTRNLEKCYICQKRVFRKMYGFSIPEASMEEVVKSIPSKNLDWAMKQVEITLERNFLIKKYREKRKLKARRVFVLCRNYLTRSRKMRSYKLK